LLVPLRNRGPTGVVKILDASLIHGAVPRVESENIVIRKRIQPPNLSPMLARSLKEMIMPFYGLFSLSRQ